MTDKIKKAFDGICAEENLKINTLSFLRERAQEKNSARDFFKIKKVSAAIAFSLVVFLCVLGQNLYFSESFYIDLDVNPSIELVVNRFDRVIDANAYNPEGADILSDVNVMHKNYQDAVDLLLEEMMIKGFIYDYGLVSVTLQTGSGNRDAEMSSTIETIVRHHNNAVEINVLSVEGDVRYAAHNWGMSPAKYLAILELQEVDPTITIEGCRHNTIREIHQLRDNRDNRHNADSDGYNTQNHHNEGARQDAGGNTRNEERGGGHHQGGRHH